MGDQSPERVRRGHQLGAALACALSLVTPTALAAPPESPAASPEGPSPLPGVEDETPPDTSEPAPLTEDPPPATTEAATTEAAPPATNEPRVPPPRVTEEIIGVAVGVSPDAPGSRAELAIVDALEQGARASRRPTTRVRRLRVGAADPRTICREGRDDLVIVVGYMPDDARPMLITHDCRLDRELPARSAQAAEDSDLVGVLWQEHRVLVAQGVPERKRRMNPRLRNGLIIGAAAVVVGVAIGLLVASALRDETVVLKVAP